MTGKLAIVFAVLAALLLHHGECNMSEAQLKAAAKLMRNVCQPKTKASSESIIAFHKGNFMEDDALKCYMECCLRTGKLIKDGKVDMDSFMKAVENMPENRLEPIIASATKCKDAGVGKEKCQLAFDFYKCVYEDNPENFFFP